MCVCKLIINLCERACMPELIDDARAHTQWPQSSKMYNSIIRAPCAVVARAHARTRVFVKCLGNSFGAGVSRSNQCAPWMRSADSRTRGVITRERARTHTMRNDYASGAGSHARPPPPPPAINPYMAGGAQIFCWNLEDCAMNARADARARARSLTFVRIGS